MFKYTQSVCQHIIKHKKKKERMPKVKYQIMWVIFDILTLHFCYLVSLVSLCLWVNIYNKSIRTSCLNNFV